MPSGVFPNQAADVCKMLESARATEDAVWYGVCCSVVDNIAIQIKPFCSDAVLRSDAACEEEVDIRKYH